MGYKLYRFCENRARDTLLCGVYIPHVDQISVKILVLGVSYPYRTLHPLSFMGVSLVAPMEVKLGKDRGGDLWSTPPCQISPASVQCCKLKIETTAAKSDGGNSH